MDPTRQLPRIKKLTCESWRTADSASRLFIAPMEPDRDADAADAWARAFLQPKLSDRVPEAVRQLFEVAQGAMVYGYFYYPLYTLGSEQLYRVYEAALRYRCRELGAPAKIRGFAKMLEWLAANEGEVNLEVWDPLREMRNAGSHPDVQQLSAPSMAMSDLEIAVRLIEKLFAGAAAATDAPNDGIADDT
jgi:hypothetical protein